mmetsp:Transcript_58986/g.132755  ORF Transcript_58986/g.132755 Transcript_58986/m.132755 type:complete len:93 (+) Transcript_58986:443-721(+)
MPSSQLRPFLANNARLVCLLIILNFDPVGRAGLFDFHMPKLQQQLKPSEPSSPALPMEPSVCPGQLHFFVQEQPVFAMYALHLGGCRPAFLT